MTFILHASLEKKLFITDLRLSRVLMADEQNYPWLYLVPRRENVSRIMDLSVQDQLQLMQELDLAQKILWEQFKPDQLNVAALGNKVSQLHVHVIARFSHDPAWPKTVWDHPERTPFTDERKKEVQSIMRSAFLKGAQ